MAAFWPAIRRAAKFAPIAVRAGRRLDRQVRPHLLAYRLAHDIDGYVARWTTQGATHWAVFAETSSAEPVRVFPPLDRAEIAVLVAELDRSTLRHHSELPEARARDTAGRIVSAPGRAGARFRRDDAGGEDDDGAAGPGGGPPAPSGS